MRHITYLSVLFLTVMVGIATADQLIDTRGLPYKGTVTGYRDYTLTMRVTGIGRPRTTTLDKIRMLTIDNATAFNQAEALVGKKKFAEAVPAYDKALQAVPAGKSWLQSLTNDRRYQALSRAGMIDMAVKQWLEMMDANPASKIVQGMVPETFAPEGDPANAAALKLLNAKLAALETDDKNKDYTERVLKLKMKLLEAMGEEEKATDVAEAVTQLDEPVEASPTTPGEAPAAPSQGDLDVLRRLVKSGKYDEVIETLGPRMETLPRNQLAAPLFLLGKTQWLKYQQDAPRDRKLLLRAGLNLMWVYSSFSDSDDALEALYLVGEIHQAMGDTTAAKRAWRELTEQFGGMEDNPWVVKANEQLQAE